MKNLLFLFIFLVTQSIFSQRFFKTGDSIFTEEKFNSKIKMIKEENYIRRVEPFIFESVKKNDSLINNVIIISSDYKFMSEHELYSLLNQPFPSFSFRDLKNVRYSNVFFLNKPTIVCIWKSNFFLPTRKIIKTLNKINEEDQFNVVGFVVNDINERDFVKKPNFPIFKNTEEWLQSNLPSCNIPKYLIVNGKGVLSFLFLRFPSKNDLHRVSPIDTKHKEIFEHLLN